MYTHGYTLVLIGLERMSYQRLKVYREVPRLSSISNQRAMSSVWRMILEVNTVKFYYEDHTVLRLSLRFWSQTANLIKMGLAVNTN